MKALFLYKTTNIFKSITVAAAVALTGCGQSEEDKNKTIEEAVNMRADQVCKNGDGSLDDYSKYMNYLTEQLSEKGITGADTDKAIDMFEQKVKSSCPDKFPK